MSAGGPGAPVPGTVIGRTSHFRVSVASRPFNSGEVVLEANRPGARFESLSAEEIAELADWLARVERALLEVYNPEGVNIGLRESVETKGCVVHVVPRWTGDMSFMPVVTGTKVFPEAPADTVRSLRDVLFPS